MIKSRTSKDNVKFTTAGFRISKKELDEVNTFLQNNRIYKTPAQLYSTALKKMLHPEEDTDYFDAMLRRMARQKAAIERNTLKVEMLGDVLLCFCRYFFQAMPFPEYTPEERVKADTEANSTWTKFRRFLSKQWMEGPQFQENKLFSGSITNGLDAEHKTSYQKTKVNKESYSYKISDAYLGTDGEGHDPEPSGKWDTEEGPDPRKEPLP